MVDVKRTLVICVDASETSIASFKWAIQMLARPTDEIHVLHVIQPASAYAPAGFTRSGQFDDYYAALQCHLEEKSKELLRKLVEHARQAGVKTVAPVSVTGDARVEIVVYAEEHHATLVILGSRGLGMVKRALLGSVSEHVIKECSCPVLVVRGVSGAAHQAGVEVVHS